MIIKEFKGEYFTINWQVKTWKIVIKIPYFSYFKDRKIPTFFYFWLKIPTFLTSPTTFHPEGWWESRRWWGLEVVGGLGVVGSSIGGGLGFDGF